MSDQTKIEWADATFNPWIGCTKVSAGCSHCYAESMDHRFGGGHWGKGAPRKRTSVANWLRPLAWNRKAAKDGTRPRVFCASLADVFDPEVPDAWRADLFELIAQCRNLDWLLLTKRPGEVMGLMHAAHAYIEGVVGSWDEAGEDPSTPGSWMLNSWYAGERDNDFPEHVWLGTSVEDQAAADERIPQLLAVPARVRFLSCEPLLGPLDLDMGRCDTHDRDHVVMGEHGEFCNECAADGWSGELSYGAWLDPCADERQPGINWVIAGGESGPGARPMHPDWARSLRDQCQSAGVPFFFKQWGEWAPGECCDCVQTRTEDVAKWWDGRWDFGRVSPTQSSVMHCDDEPDVWRLGKKRAGRLLDGVLHDEVPA